MNSENSLKPAAVEMGDHADMSDHFDESSYPPCFLTPANGLGPEKLEDSDSDSDIEMITLQSSTYTSLRDILPTSPPQSVMSPANNSSCQEVSISNPLVKQAALAYLQPMSTPTEVTNTGLLAHIGEALQWLPDAVLSVLRGAFWEPTAEGGGRGR